MESWPINPLDNIIQWIRENHGDAVVADMGCGEARLAKSVTNLVHSFDMVSSHNNVMVPPYGNRKEYVSKIVEVTSCDISHVPLSDESVDIVVFCLSLMGTNLQDFVREAHRILKPTGIVKIVEVRSRFYDNAANKHGNDAGLRRFVSLIESTGFSVHFSESLGDNRMFFELECRKQGVSHLKGKVKKFSAKPCIYKRR